MIFIKLFVLKQLENKYFGSNLVLKKFVIRHLLDLNVKQKKKLS